MATSAASGQAACRACSRLAVQVAASPGGDGDEGAAAAIAPAKPPPVGMMAAAKPARPVGTWQAETKQAAAKSSDAVPTPRSKPVRSGDLSSWPRPTPRSCRRPKPAPRSRRRGEPPGFPAAEARTAGQQTPWPSSSMPVVSWDGMPAAEAGYARPRSRRSAARQSVAPPRPIRSRPPASHRRSTRR